MACDDGGVSADTSTSTDTTSGDGAETPRSTPIPSVIHEGLPTQLPDIDPEETSDWLASFDGLVEERGRERARYVMLRLLERAREKAVGVPALRTTDAVLWDPSRKDPALLAPGTRVRFVPT